MKATSRRGMAILTLFAGLAAGLLLAPIAQAATGQISIIETNSPQPSGSSVDYVIGVQCSAILGETCGEHPTIRIPLDATTTPPMSTWNIEATGPTGLIVEQHLEGSEYVIVLRDGIPPGTSGTIQLEVTPPNGVTPDGTSWELQPTFESSDFPLVEAPTPAPGEATAETSLAVTKNTSDGGAVYVSGNQVTYNVTARCNSGFPTGSLYLKDANLVDQLPPEAVFVSAAPPPTSAPAPGTAGGELVWEFENPGTMPPGCVENAGGTANYQVVVEIPAATPNNTVITNSATLSGTPIGKVLPISTSAEKELTAISEPPPGPGTGFVGKTSIAPLNIPNPANPEGEIERATYPGHWITPANPTPSTAANAAEGRYTVNIRYPASRAFETDLVDPMPCLEAKNGVEYPSLPVVGDVAGPGSAPVCAEPAFHPTAIRVTSASLPEAVAEGWRINLITVGGIVVPVAAHSSSGNSTYFDVPEALVGKIAAVEVPPNAHLTDVSMSMDVWGYADASVPAGSDLHDIAVASAYPIGSATPAGTGSQAADIYVEPNLVQLAVRKSFGALHGGPGGTTTMSILGGISVPPAYTLPGPVVLADLLPAGLEWVNPPATGEATFTVRDSAGSSASVPATTTAIPNYLGSGRELIRVSLPASAFAEPGVYTIEAPSSSFFELNVPKGARTYDNEADVFVNGIGRETAALCGKSVGASSELESKDPLDLDGDGVLEENHCVAKASLTVPGEGPPAFILEKLVKGDLDPLPQRSPAIGHSTPGGSAEYTLNWANIGGKPLEEPVIYDILPYVGDTGVSGSEAGTARDSEFQVTFGSVVAPANGEPPGITVEYSESTNPCRPEVYATNPGCVEDWTPVQPAASAVRALRFVSGQTYQPGQAFAVAFTVNLPKGEVNTVAWNSAATDADAAGIPLLPAEPPKVGITAEARPVTPTLSTAVSAADVKPGTAFHDAIEIADTGSYAGELEWKLLGPVPANSAGTCDGVDWNGAKVFDEGTIETSAAGTYPTPASAPTAEGCYGYVVTLGGAGFTAPVTSPAGSAGEVVQVRTPPVPPVPPVPPPPAPPGPDLTIVKRVGSSQVMVGQPLNYTIEVRNKGKGAAHHVVVTDSPGTPMAFVSATPSKGTCNEAFPLRCELGTIAAGGKATVKVTAKPLEAGAVVNSATVKPDDPGVKPEHSRAKSKAMVPLKLEKTASTSKVEAGHGFRYTIRVTNPSVASARGVRICDQLPAGIVYRGGAPAAKLKDGGYCWTVTVAPHSTKKIVVRVRALPGSTGRLVNVARLSGREVPARSARAAVRVKPRPARAGGVTG